MTDGVLHPALQGLAIRQRRRLRRLGLLLFLSLALGLLGGIVVALTSENAGGLLLLGLTGGLVFPIIILIGGVLWILDRRLSRGLNSANRLLRDCAPQSVQLQPMAGTHRTGALALLRLATPPAIVQEPVSVLINPDFRWSALPRQEIALAWYCKELVVGSSWVGLRYNDAPLLGKIVDQAAYFRRKRLVKALLGILLLIGVFAVGLAMLDIDWKNPAWDGLK